MAVERNWQRHVPFHDLSSSEIEQLIQPFARGARVLEAVAFEGGRRNSNYRLRLDSHEEPVVLRIYQSTDLPQACEREAAVLSLVGATVRAPRVLHAEHTASPPWSIVSWLPGARFDEFLVDASVDAVASCSRSAGGALASIHAYSFEKPGWLTPELTLTRPPWPEISWAEMLGGWLTDGNFGLSLTADRRSALLTLVHENGNAMASLMSGARLVHADYKPWNLLVRDGAVSGVLDWEGAYSGNPLVDLGIYLRYSDRMPPVYRDAFAVGYLEAGGQLPDDWFRLVRLTDLTNLGYFLEFRGSDQAILRDVLPLIDRTLDDFAR